MADYTSDVVIATPVDPRESPRTLVYSEVYIPAVSLPDPTGPALANLSPATGSAIDDDTVIEFDVTDSDGLEYIAIYARYIDKRDFDVVYAGGSFAPKYTGSTVGAISGGYHFEVRRDTANVGGWRSQGRVRFQVVALDTVGNLEV